MTQKPPLLSGASYHIYNRGLNKSRLFAHEDDFNHFLYLMRVYLCPVADILSYALMKNHFHIALRVKADEEIGWLIPENAISVNPEIKWATTFEVSASLKSKPHIHPMLRHMLGAYTKWFNKRYKRSGKLFEERHERKVVLDEDYMRKLIAYINRNPQHHRVVKSFQMYKWISFHELTDCGQSWLAKGIVMELFHDRETFIAAMDKLELDDWLKALE